MGQRLSLRAAFEQLGEYRKGKQNQRLLTELQSRGNAVRHQPDSKLMDMPLDLLCMIFDLLDVEDSVALSLACKGLYSHLFADSRKAFEAASPEDKRRVQTMLEKDIAHLDMFCPFCRAFHGIGDGGRGKGCLEKDKLLSSSFFAFLPGCKPSGLTYGTARYIVNVALFKRPFLQSDLDTLVTREFRSGSRGCYWWQSWAGKVADGELMLKICSEHVGRRGDKFTFSLCKHVHIYGKFPHLWTDISALDMLLFYTTRNDVRGTCRTCLAEWTLNITWKGDKKTSTHRGWDIGMISWHRLGDVRSPYSQEWARSAGEGRSPDPAWMDGDSIYLNDHEKWEEEHQHYGKLDDLHLISAAQRIWESTS